MRLFEKSPRFMTLSLTILLAVLLASIDASLSWGGEKRPPADPRVLANVQKLRSPKDRDRIDSCLALAKLGLAGGGALSALQLATKDSNYEVRINAIKAIAAIGATADSISSLRAALKDREPGVAEAAANALAKAGPLAKDAVGDLTHCLSRKEPFIALSSAEALGKIGEPARVAVPALKRLVKEQPAYRSEVERIISQLAPDLVASDAWKGVLTNLKSMDVFRRRDALKSVPDLAPDAEAAAREIITCLEDPELTIRLLAIESLGRYKSSSKPAVSRLIEAIHDSDPQIQHAAIVTLGKIGDNNGAVVAAIVEYSQNALNERGSAGLQASMMALGELKPKSIEAVNLLREIVRTHALKRQAASVLGTLGPFAKDSFPELLGLLKSESAKERASGAISIAGIALPGDREVLFTHLELASRDPDRSVQLAASVAILRISPKDSHIAIRIVKDVLSSGNVNEKTNALIVAGILGPVAKDLAAIVARHTRDSNEALRHAAIAALKKIQPGQ